MAANVLDWIERRGETYPADGRYWVLDPVDGTKGFLRGEQYAIALALVVNGRVELGVLGCPNLPASLTSGGNSNEVGGQGEIAWAIRGQGAWRMPLDASDQPTTAARLRVAEAGSDAATTWVERVESSGRNKDVSSEIAGAAGIGRPPHRLDSQAKYAVVARGEASAVPATHARPRLPGEGVGPRGGSDRDRGSGGTSHRPGGPIARFFEGPELSGNRGIVATNGEAHERVLASIRQHLSAEALAAG